MQCKSRIATIHVDHRALWLARRLQANRNLLAAFDPLFDQVVDCLIREGVEAEADVRPDPRPALSLSK